MRLTEGIRLSIRAWPLLLSSMLGWWGMQRPLPPPSMSDVGLAALADTLFALALWGYLVLVGAGLGRWGFRRVGHPWVTPTDAVLWTVPTGLVLLGYPVYALGLLGLLHPPWIAAMLLGLTVWLRHDLQSAATELGQAARLAWIHIVRVVRGSHAARWAWGIMAILLGISFLLALTPPTEYDTLWYHLQAPRLFLEAGRVYPEHNNWPANYAFALSMVYAIPMALGSDVASKLVHWTFSIALLGLVYSLARSATGSLAWIAPAFVLTMPHFLVRLAPQAMADGAAACLEVMAFSGLMYATEKRNQQWLRAAGIWAGLAMGVKFSALPILVAGVLFWMWRGYPASWIQRMKELPVFLLPALALAAPWYLKNAIWFGAPLFPAGIPSTDPEVRFRAFLFLEYIQGRSATGLDRLLFLYWLLTMPNQLDFVIAPIALPLVAFLFVLPSRGIARDALVLGSMRALLWIIGPPRIRFLISTFALWGIAASITAARCQFDPRLMHRRIGQVIAGAHLMMVIVTLTLIMAVVSSHHPWHVVLGMESRADYLRRTLDGYRGMEYIWDHLGSHDRVLLIGDARHYYCPSRCYPEADHFTWPRIVWASNFDPEAVIRRLEAMEITHLWIHRGSVTWLLNHDPGGWMRRSYDFLRTRFAPLCAQRVYADEDVELLYLTCISRASNGSP